MADVRVVDDDEIIRGMLAFLFEGEGHEVEQCAGGAEALEVLRRRRPECMVLDLMMPDVDGLSVLRTRQQESIAPDTRIIVLTAKSPRTPCGAGRRGPTSSSPSPSSPTGSSGSCATSPPSRRPKAAHRREKGLADFRRLDAIEAALRGRR